MYHSRETLNTRIPSVVCQQEMNRLMFKDIVTCTRSKTLSQHMNSTTRQTSIFDLNHCEKLFLTTHISLTLNMDMTPIGMMTYVIRTNWSTKILTINPMIKLRKKDITTCLHVSDALRYALIDLWTVNPQLPDQNYLTVLQNHKTTKDKVQSPTIKFYHSAG